MVRVTIVHRAESCYMLTLLLLQSMLCIVHCLSQTDSGDNLFAGGTDSIQDAKVLCEKPGFPSGLNLDNCANAWAKVDKSIQPYIYAERPVQQGEIALPIRYLSDDGSCAIDVTFNPNPEESEERGDVANGIAISNAARAVILQCVGRTRSGGQKQDFTPHGRLTVSVTIYRSKVSCWSPRAQRRAPPNPNACQDALQQMPASPNKQLFDRTGGENAELVPREFLSQRKSYLIQS